MGNYHVLCSKMQTNFILIALLTYGAHCGCFASPWCLPLGNNNIPRIKKVRFKREVERYEPQIDTLEKSDAKIEKINFKTARGSFQGELKHWPTIWYLQQMNDFIEKQLRKIVIAQLTYDSSSSESDSSDSDSADLAQPM